MADKDKLNQMLDDLIDNKGEQAEIHFHDYLQTKMQEIIHGEDLADEQNSDEE